MKSNRRHILALCAATALASAPISPAFALFGLGSGRIVYDPTNHVENIITAIKTTLSLIENIKTNMDGQAIINTVAGSPELAEMLAGLEAANGLYAALKDSKKVMDNLQNVFGASPYENWEDFAANIAKRKELGDKQATMLYDAAYAADKQIRVAFSANRKIQDAASSVNGPTEAIQSVVNAVGVVIDQNSTMLYTLAAANKMHGQELEREATEREQLEKSKKKYFDKVRKAKEIDKAILNKAGIKTE